MNDLFVGAFQFVFGWLPESAIVPLMWGLIVVSAIGSVVVNTSWTIGDKRGIVTGLWLFVVAAATVALGGLVAANTDSGAAATLVAALYLGVVFIGLPILVSILKKR